VKKLITFALTCVMCLSMWGCGGDEANLKETNSGNNQSEALSVKSEETIAEETTAEETIAETEAPPSEEKFLEEATDYSFTTLHKDQSDNPARAKAYCGKIIKVTGYIEYIYEDHVTVVPLDTSYALNSPAVRLDVTFSPEDMMIFSRFDVINFVGKIDSVSGDYSSVKIEMAEAFYIDDIVEITGKVTDQFLYNMDHNCAQMEVNTTPEQCGDYNRRAVRATYYATDHTDFTNYDSIKIKDVEVKPEDEVVLKGKFTFAGLRYTPANGIETRIDYITLDVKELTDIEVK